MIQAETIRDALQKLAPPAASKSSPSKPSATRTSPRPCTTLESTACRPTNWKKILSKELDVIVHCLKSYFHSLFSPQGATCSSAKAALLDVPTTLPESCTLVGIPLRDNPRDGLVVKAGTPYFSLKTLPRVSWELLPCVDRRSCVACISICTSQTCAKTPTRDQQR